MGEWGNIGFAALGGVEGRGRGRTGREQRQGAEDWGRLWSRRGRGQEAGGGRCGQAGLFSWRGSGPEAGEEVSDGGALFAKEECGRQRYVHGAGGEEAGGRNVRAVALSSQKI